MWKMLLLILTFSIITACGDGYDSDDDDDDDVTNQDVEREDNFSDFSTRLSNRLLISGRKCIGNETTTDANGATVTCQADQWLITLDDANTCQPDGACTEIGVIPFVAELDPSDRIELPTYTYFEIDPLSAVTPTQENKIDDYLVRFEVNTLNAEVVPK